MRLGRLHTIDVYSQPPGLIPACITRWSPLFHEPPIAWLTLISSNRTMSNLPSLIAADVGFERTGFQTGTLRLPRSHDRSAYGHVPIPLAVLNAGTGTGPTVLLTGGKHGDEHEGPVTPINLLQRLPSTTMPVN